MAKKSIISIMREIQSSKNTSEIIDSLSNSEFWSQIIPMNEKTVEIRAPNVVFVRAADAINIDPMGVAGKVRIESSGEVIFEDKGEDNKGRFLDFYIRDNNLAERLEGRLRLRNTPNGFKIGIFVYDLEMKENTFSLGKTAAEFVLRTKLRMLVDLLEKNS